MAEHTEHLTLVFTKVRNILNELCAFILSNYFDKNLYLHLLRVDG